MDENGLDPSKAVVHRTVVEKGSGPLTAIVRVEGEYRYGREDHYAAPFVTRIHAYAGRSHLRVLHTFIYTGEPDRHRKQEGEHAHVATQGIQILEEDPEDPGWTEPKDRIAAAGLSLKLGLYSPLHYRTAMYKGNWWEEEAAELELEGFLEGDRPWFLLQNGPRPTRMPPLPVSTSDKRLEGFEAVWSQDGTAITRGDKSPGWLDVTDGARGVATGTRYFLEEYPKELRIDAGGRLTSFLWTPRVEPMSFARWNARRASTQAVENWARGLAKTSELVCFFSSR
jgi:hypothetical protein